MNIEWLEDLLAVIETGSFNHAAEARHITQPAFSRRIRSIETALGAELFDRNRKPVRLKSHVLDQEQQIRTLTTGVRQLKRELQSAGTRSSLLTLASQHAISATMVPRVLGVLGGSDDLRIRLRSANRNACVAMLLAGETELVMLYQMEDESGASQESFIETAVIGTDRLVPVIAKASPLTRDLANDHGVLPIVFYPPHEFLGQVLSSNLLPFVSETHVIENLAETALTSAALQFAVSGIAIAWVPETLASRDLADGTLVSLDDQLPSVPMNIVMQRRRGEHSEPLEKIWELILRL